MSAPTGTAPATGTTDPIDPDLDGTDPIVGDEDEIEGAEALGEAGKKALDAMKAKVKESRAREKLLEQQLADATKPKPKEGEPDLDAIRAEASKEATARANERILRSEIRAQATGKLANPALALRLLDLTDFEVDNDGNVDTDEINDAIAKLIEDNPGLGIAQGEPPKRFKGTADGGARNGSQPAQITAAQVKSMTPEQIVEAQKKGLLRDYLAS